MFWKKNDVRNKIVPSFVNGCTEGDSILWLLANGTLYSWTPLLVNPLTTYLNEMAIWFFLQVLQVFAANLLE